MNNMQIRRTIKISGNLTSDYSGYNQIVRFINVMSAMSNTHISIDFQYVFFLEANLCAILGVAFEIVESNKNEIHLINLNPKVETIMRKNEFLTRLGYSPMIDEFKTTLPYRKFVPSNDEGFNEYISTNLLSQANFPSHSEKLGKEILRNIFEIFENARTHGDCDYIHTCGQFFPGKDLKPLHFTIVDKGINIQKNVNSFLGEELSAADAIVWAMQKGNTTKTGDTSGGLGLNVIFEFIKLNKGKVHIVSSDGFYEFSDGKINVSKLSSPFNGTIVNIRFNLNDTNFYSLMSEKQNNDIIF